MPYHLLGLLYNEPLNSGRLNLSVCLSVLLSVCLSVCYSVCLFFLSVYLLFVCPCLSSVCLSIQRSLCFNGPNRHELDVLMTHVFEGF